ncbi:MAG: agmatinase [candidate division Zixibacteria bacterium 4484_95]|nr:MAG: agmatinase [candidate division Zixibacteria bacterium 4484_95]
MYDSVSFNFLGLSNELADYHKAGVAILPIPYELTLTYEPGARNGPQAIISASRHLETYDETLELDPSSVGIATLPEIEQVVSSPKEMQDIIYKKSMKILDDGKFLLSLGGEHSITIALVKGHKEKYNNLSVLHIDAHTDLRDSYQGSRFSHACVMARVAEMAPFITVGVRSFSNDDNERKYSDRIIKISEYRKNPDIFEKIIANLSENVYITVDLDSFDPSVMPAVGTPEPGGLNWEEMMSIINATALKKRIVGGDIVELSPRIGLTYADFTAAKLAYKIIAKGFLGE